MNKWNKLLDKISFNTYGTTDVTLEEEYYNDPYIIVWFDIDNDLHESYDHEPLLKEIHETVKGADDISEAGDGILAIYLGIDTETSEEVVNKVIDEINQVRPIINKYWKE